MIVIGKRHTQLIATIDDHKNVEIWKEKFIKQTKKLQKYFDLVSVIDFKLRNYFYKFQFKMLLVAKTVLYLGTSIVQSISHETLKHIKPLNVATV